MPELMEVFNLFLHSYTLYMRYQIRQIKRIYFIDCTSLAHHYFLSLLRYRCEINKRKCMPIINLFYFIFFVSLFIFYSFAFFHLVNIHLLAYTFRLQIQNVRKKVIRWSGQYLNRLINDCEFYNYPASKIFLCIRLSCLNFSGWLFKNINCMQTSRSRGLNFHVLISSSFFFKELNCIQISRSTHFYLFNLFNRVQIAYLYSAVYMY